MVGDGTWLKLSEVMERLDRHPAATERWVRQLADGGYLATIRPVSVGRGTSHRRIAAASITALEDILALPQDQQRPALDALRAGTQATTALPVHEQPAALEALREQLRQDRGIR